MKLQVGSSGVAGSHKVERLGKSVSLRKAATGTLDGLHCVYGSTADNQVVVRSIPAARVMKIVVDRLDCSTLEKPDVDLADVEPFVLPQREGMRIRFAPTGATPGARISVADTDPAATKSRKRPSSAIGAKKSEKAKKESKEREEGQKFESVMLTMLVGKLLFYFKKYTYILILRQLYLFITSTLFIRRSSLIVKLCSFLDTFADCIVHRQIGRVRTLQ